MLQRAGSVVPRQMRVRRSADLMRHDPFSYFVVSDAEGKASGWVYHDERDGWGFEAKRFAWMRVELSGGVLRSVRAEGSFEDANEVERIVVRTELRPTGRGEAWVTCRDRGAGEWNRAEGGVREGRREEDPDDSQAAGEGDRGVGDRDEIRAVFVGIRGLWVVVMRVVREWNEW